MKKEVLLKAVLFEIHIEQPGSQAGENSPGGERHQKKTTTKTHLRVPLGQQRVAALVDRVVQALQHLAHEQQATPHDEPSRQPLQHERVLLQHLFSRDVERGRLFVLHEHLAMALGELHGVHVPLLPVDDTGKRQRNKPGFEKKKKLSFLPQNVLHARQLKVWGISTRQLSTKIRTTPKMMSASYLK